MKRISWTRDEYILVLNLYLQYRRVAPSKSDPVLEEYSNLLRKLNPEASQTEPRYRNVNGVYLRLMNYRSCDPFWIEQGKVGMSSGSTGKCKEIWDELGEDPQLVSELANEIRNEIEKASISASFNVDDNASVLEGQRRLRIHYSRERKSQRRQKLLQFKKENNSLFCEACGNTATDYPEEIQDSIFEVHHRIPLSSADGIIETKLEDLAVVCANCHRAIHSSKPMKEVNSLFE